MEANQSQRKAPAYPEKEMQCDKHGAYTSLNYIGARWSNCSKCVEEERAATEERIKAAERRDKRDQRMHRSGLQGRFADCTFDNYVVKGADQRAVYEACRSYAQTAEFNEGGGLWLIGPPGVGKTHLGSAMVRYVIEERHAGAMIYSGREIVRMLRATWGNRDGYRGDEWTMPGTEEGLIDMFGSMPLLVIDEIGASFGSEAEQVQLFDIIDERYKHRRPTVLLSNLNASDLKPALGDRAYDRLREGAKLLACKWKSYRGEPPAARTLGVVQ